MQSMFVGTLITVVAIVVLWRLFMRSGNLPFWKAVQDHPVAAAKFFNDHPDIYVGKPEGVDVTGPFLFVHPISGESSSIYIDGNRIEAVQQEFVDRIRMDGRSGTQSGDAAFAQVGKKKVSPTSAADAFFGHMAGVASAMGFRAPLPIEGP